MEMRWKMRCALRLLREPRLWALLALALIPSGARGRQCKAPEIENGRVDFIDLQFGATANFSCDEGYRLIGPTFAQCVIVGNVSDWNAKVPHCQVTCVSPELENGRTNGSLAPYGPGDVAELQCKPGYTLRGSSETQCQNDGSWDPPVPICERVGCGVPTRLSFAELKSEYRNQSYFPAGKTANYTCRPGYSRHSGIRPTITCLPNGSWSEPLKFCKRKSCGHPGELENGRINVTDMLFGSMVSFTCEEGHRLIGESSRRCEISGSHVAWSGDMPFCERIPCYPPPDIPNGKHSGVLMDEFSYGSAVTYRCDRGYLLTGEASIFCTTEDGLNGVWRPRAPRCEGGCGVPTRLSFAELKSMYKNQSYFPVGQTIGYTCLPGYSINPGMRPTITCLQNQMWSEALEFCKRKSCGHPGELENGKAVLTDTLFGSMVNFLCDEGHRLIGRPYRRCEIYGTHVEWSGGVPFCERIPCLPPPDIPNGRHTGTLKDDFSYGSAVTYTCNSSYQLTGEASIHCTTKDGLNGEWSVPPPRCEEAGCLAPQIPNGSVSDDRHVYLYKDSVTFECDSVYPMKGHRVSQCQPEGKWDSPVPVCEPVSEVLCMAPEIHHGRQVAGRQPVYRPRDRVTFECDRGYTLDGSWQIECREDATWHPSVPVCIQPLMCPPPPVIRHGKHDANSLAAFPSRTYVNYSCEPGYTLRGKASIYCTTSGMWSHPSPLCEGDWNIIFKILGIIGLLLLLLVIVFVIWKIKSKQKTGSYYTCANKNETTLISMTAENTLFAP